LLAVVDIVTSLPEKAVMLKSSPVSVDILGTVKLVSILADLLTNKS
jgi:hypothetical protein